jgi:adenosine deaminase
MCKSPLHEFLTALPKCEHHLHLEGTLEPELLFELAKKNNVSLPAAPEYESVGSLHSRYQNFQNLDDFLSFYYVGISVLVHHADYEALAYAYFAKAASQAVRHAEVFFDPQVHLARGVSFETMMSGFKQAQKRAEADFDMTTDLIMCLVRHLPLSSALETFREAVDAGYFNDGTIAAMGMDSSEKPFPPHMWTDLFAQAKTAGIRRTIHAGEEGSSDYVVQALDLLDAGRIDHGIRAMDDDALVDRLATQKTMLTMCPLSNVQLNVLGSITEFPLRKLLDRGIRFSINSDDPAYFGGYIQENYCALQEQFELNVSEWRSIAEGAVLGSWCPEARKKQLLGEIQEVAEKWMR